MGKYLNPGNNDFSSIRNGKYVDKSGLIPVVNRMMHTPEKLICISRARRFGKSFAAKMLCAYYDEGCRSDHLFHGLTAEHDASFPDHLNRYPVLYLDITWFLSTVKNKNDTVAYLQKEIISELGEVYPDVKKEKSLPHALFAIAEATEKRFVMIIDEWDAIFREKKENTALQEAYIDLLRALFKSPITDKTFVLVYITGILPIKKYGGQSAVSDFREYTMLNPGPFEPFIGFTEPEVKALCKNSPLSFEEMKHWYDGYSFVHEKSVYNPNSVMEALHRGVFDSYWGKTDTYEGLKPYIQMDFDGLREALVAMLGAGSTEINVRSFQNDMTSISGRDDVLTLLVHLGYLGYRPADKTVFIPNEEIRIELTDAVSHSRAELAKLIRESSHLYQATLDADGDTVAEIVARIHETGVAPGEYNNESCLRYVIRFAYISCIDEYVRIEELPSGHGFADVVYLPKKGSGKPAMVIELKWNKTADGALEQIKNKNYPEALRDYGAEVLLVGINYNADSKGHACVIERMGKQCIPSKAAVVAYS